MLEMLETIARDRRCPSSALRIAVALARHAGEEGPGLVELCEATGMSDSTVVRAVRIMRERGHVVTTPAMVQQCRSGRPMKHHALAPISLEEAWKSATAATRLAFVKTIMPTFDQDLEDEEAAA
jgi:DNA-binding transcriptional MocR family regulator